MYDEFKCLNLKISVPKGALEGKFGELPVMVYVHGGGFVYGSSFVGARDGEIYFPQGIGWDGMGMEADGSRNDTLSGIVNKAGNSSDCS